MSKFQRPAFYPSNVMRGQSFVLSVLKLPLKAAILLYQSSPESKKFVKLKKTQLFCLVINEIKPFAVPKGCARWKIKKGIDIIFFVLIITLMLLRIFSETLMCISNKQNYKTFTKGPPAFLLHCIENILNHSSGKSRDSLKMVALSFIKPTGLYTIFIH